MFNFNKKKPKLIKPSKTIEAGIESYHNGNFLIRGNQKIKIGSYNAFGKNISIITEYHDTNFIAIQGTIYSKIFSRPHPGTLIEPPNKERTKGGVSIGNDVWIGDGCYIMSGVIIGDGACIAANSVVTKNIDPYTFYAGVPAKKIKPRYEKDTISFLLELQWWNWTPNKIKRNEQLFYLNLNTASIKEIKNCINE